MANPPVCRIMDYGKFRYEEAQKAKESRRKTRPVSDQGDEVPPEDRHRAISTPRSATSQSSSAKATR